MAIKQTFQVHNPHVTPAAHRVKLKGAEVMASVDTLEVELRSTDVTHGGIKLRFVGDEVAAARELFVNDAIITVSFDAASAEEHAAATAAIGLDASVTTPAPAPAPEAAPAAPPAA